jgi:hypothetical protein
MNTRKCKSCGQESEEWVEFCTKCAEPMENYSRPAGFWVRVGAAIIDYLIFIPILILAIWNGFTLKSTFLLILIHLPGLIYINLLWNHISGQHWARCLVGSKSSTITATSSRCSVHIFDFFQLSCHPPFL